MGQYHPVLGYEGGALREEHIRPAHQRRFPGYLRERDSCGVMVGARVKRESASFRFSLACGFIGSVRFVCVLSAVLEVPKKATKRNIFFGNALFRSTLMCVWRFSHLVDITAVHQHLVDWMRHTSADESCTW